MGMTKALQIDAHEPLEMVDLISQSVEVDFRDLNTTHLADYRWEVAGGGHPKHIERKTWRDLLSDLSSVENQLMRQLRTHEDHDLALLIEGVIVPDKGLLGGTAILLPSKDSDRIWYRSNQSKVHMQALFAWIYQVSKFIEVYQTPNLVSTARALVAFYKSDQKEDHQTFSRHLKEMTFHPNAQVTSLMGLLPGLGPIKGEALIAHFSTVWEVLNSTPEKLAQVHGIGIKESTRWLRLVGRPDV